MLRTTSLPISEVKQWLPESQKAAAFLKIYREDLVKISYKYTDKNDIKKLK